MTDVLPVKSGRSPQVRPRLREVCRLLVEEGRTLAQAAQTAGMTYESARVALHKPHVQAFLASLKRERLGFETIRSMHRVAELRDTAQSEKVSLDAAKLLMTAAGDLQPEERDRSPASGVVVQIVVADYHQALPITVSDKGVIEAPPYQPSLEAPARELVYVDAEG